MTLSLVRTLNDIDLSLAVAGGKGANLARLSQAGLPVPPGFVLTTAAYDRYVAANRLGQALLDGVRGLPAGDLPALEAASAALRARFAGGEMPADVRRALFHAYARLGALPVAVRSSATAEDLPGASFAGQQDTTLNVVGEAALCRAVVNCWSSLWTARAISYRERGGISHAGLSLAVVVQEMAPSRASGVLFTANPLTGRRGEVVIDAAFGLGEALVSGQVEPDQYVVGAGGTILAKRLGSKALAIHAREGGGTVSISGEAPAAQALDDETIVELARLGRRVEALFGSPQDVEWAEAGGRLSLLQSRPITTLYPTPQGVAAHPPEVMFSFASVQGMLDPMTPMGRDLMRAAAAGAGRLFDRQSSIETQRVLREAGERLWVNFSGLLHNRVGRKVVRAALPSIDAGAARALTEVLLEESFTRPGPLSARTALRLLRVLIPALARAALALLRPDAERARLVGRLDALVERAERQRAGASTQRGRVDLLRRMAGSALRYMFPQFVPRFGVGMAGYSLLARLAASLPGGGHDVQAMTRGLPHNVTTEMDLALWKVAQAVRADAPSADRFRRGDPDALAGAYLDGTLPPRAQGALGAFMARYGMRGLAEIDVGRPRWREDPTPVIRSVLSYLSIEDPEAAPDAVFGRGRAAAEAEIARLVDALRRTRGGWFKARLARAAARRMRALVGLRETPKFTAIRVFDLLREMLLDSGAELAGEGLLDRADDVFYLYLDELEALGRGDRRDWRGVVRARRRAGEREGRRRQIPRLLLSDGRAYYGGAAPEHEDGSTLQGVGVSPGVVEGIARVVVDPRRAQLAPGEILICPGTDPSWTPLFLAAGGLVMEVGGMMTHGGVVAREYGIPAVVGVHEATQRLRTGQRLRVDGSTGRIAICDPAADGG